MSPKNNSLAYEDLNLEVSLDREFTPELNLIIPKRMQIAKAQDHPAPDQPILISGSLTVSF